ncbi:hypothetical protein ALC60_10812 [Trachymyrmex zeteki]|uniref:DDE Tnp4 domain-containing protein n=1 Tax=Mycetomoellerius zeteki TaxID=64791 RepID=A0A151WQE7_9HYME|nr:hypothetical protein ALC60_10812 [Trachymyrmex zeteki]
MAIAYINKFGSVQHPHLTDIAREIWKWYKERNVLFASYITSVDNVIADSEYRVLRLLTFSRFSERSDLCVVTILDHCLQRTETLHPPECNSLLISCVKPYRAVGVQSMSRWIRKGLEECGMRGDLYSAHGSKFYNHKGYFSIVLMGACDADYKFTWVDIGQYGSVSDGGVWNNIDFVQDLEAEEVDLPLPSPLPGEDIPFSYVFVADEAFPLKKYIMRPYPKKNDRMSDDERIFNYRLSRARRVIENTFGILAAKWQILNSCINCSPKHAEQIAKALVCLHNFLITSSSEYCPPWFTDTERSNGETETEAWRREINQTLFSNLSRIGANRASQIANEIRNYLKEYFVSEIGQQQAMLPWQNERALHGHFINVPG